MGRSDLEGWVSVYETSTDYEADMVRDRLDSSDIPAVVLTQRDHAFNLNVSSLATVHVMVPPEHQAGALAIIEGEPFTSDELNAAALSSRSGDEESDDEDLMDSGNEEIHLSAPEDEDEEERDV